MNVAVGQRLAGTAGHYLVEALHASGGFGISYLARREEDGCPVLVKVLRLDRLKEWKSLELFQREASVLRRLSHPGIPAYLDEVTLGTPEVPEGFGLVQELVPGTDLARLARAGERFTRPALLDGLEQLLRVLDYLHRQAPPVIHRDVSPKNIVRRPDGALVLVDFGTVQAALRDDQSVASTAAGTFGFSPLEQFVGRASPASDLYALGMTFLCLASGRQPEQMPLDGIRVRVKDLLPGDRELGPLLAAMTAPDPRERLPDAATALARLAAIRSGARPPQPAPVASPAPSLRRIAWLTAVLGTVLLVGILGYWTFLGATGTYYLVYAADPGSGEIALKAYHREGSIASGQVTVRDGPGRWCRTRPLPSDAYLCGLSGHDLTYFTRDRGSGTTFWSVPLEGGSPRELFRTDLRNQWETCALREGGLAMESDDPADRVRVLLQARSGAPAAPAPGTLPGDHHPAWSPDGQTLVVSSQRAAQDTLVAIDLATGRRQDLTSAAGPQHQDIRPAFDPDGRQIAFYRSSRRRYGDGANRQTSAAFDLHVLDLASKQAGLVLQDVCFGSAPAWTGPHTIAYGRWTGRHCGLHLYDLKTAEERLLADDY